MAENSKNIAIGILVTVAVVLVSWVLIFLHPSTGDNGKILHVRFPNVDKISTGTRVAYAGKPIGEVKSVSMIPDARDQEQAGNKEIFPYEVTLAIDSKVDVYDCDEISVKTEGLMGERSITISPRRPAKGTKAKPFEHNAVTYAMNCNTMEDTISGFNSVVNKADKALDEVLNIFAQNEVNFQKTMLSAEALSEELKKLIEKANNVDLIGSVKDLTVKIEEVATNVDASFKKFEDQKLIDNIAQTTQKVNELIATIKPEAIDEAVNNTLALTRNAKDFSQDLANSWDIIKTTLDSVSEGSKQLEKFVAASEKSLKNIETVTDNVANGKGTIGKLLVQDDLYIKLNTVVAKADILMNDVNQYGPLFHLNKTWQRERIRKMAELANLNTPSDFKAYLDEELQKVTLAIARVSMAMNKANNVDEANAGKIKQDFTKTYTDLISQVQELSNNLKLIQEQQNQAVTDMTEQK